MKRRIATRVLAMLTSLFIAGTAYMPAAAEGSEGTKAEEVSQSENRIAEDDADETEPEAYIEETAVENAGSALSDFEYGEDSGVYYITNYIGTSPTVTVPDKNPDGNPITGIGSDCFRDKTGITDVTIPEGITIINKGAFSGCTGIKTLTINAREIRDFTRYEDSRMAFYNAGSPDGMTVTFGSGVKRIPAFMFYTNVYDKNSSKNYCKISKLVISDSVTEMGNTAFTNCWDLKEVEGGSAVKTMESWVFSNTGLTKYPASLKAVETMGEGCFDGAYALAEADLPEGLTDLGPRVFEDCLALKSVTLPATLLRTAQSVFKNCTALTTLNINCAELRDVTRYEDSRMIFYNAGAPSGMTVTFGSGVKRIPAFMFYTNVYDKNSNKNYCKISKLVISDSVTEIGNTAFTNCWDLKEVEGGSAVKTMESWAFSNTGLTKYPADFKAVEEMGEGCFYGAAALAEINLPEGITYIGVSAFEDCTALTTVTLPASLVTLEYATFKNCTGLKNVTIKSKELKDCRYTDNRAVFYNAGVEVGDGFTVNFTSGVTHIPACLFGVDRDKNSSKDWCRLYEVFIPGTVKDVGDWSFQDCYALKKIHFQGKAPNIGDNAFYNDEAEAFYPDGDKSWTKDKCKDYGGKLTWKSESGKPNTDVSKLTDEVVNSAVTFISNGAEETGPFFTINKSGKKAKLIKLHKKGYTFKGWYMNGKKVKSLTPKFLKKNPQITLEAKFTPIKYTISYKVPKKVDGVKVKGKIKLTKDEKKISYEGGMLTAKGSELECEGHTLKGWSIVKGGSEVAVRPGETVSLERLIPDKGKTIKLYPVW